MAAPHSNGPYLPHGLDQTMDVRGMKVADIAGAEGGLIGHFYPDRSQSPAFLTHHRSV